MFETTIAASSPKPVWLAETNCGMAPMASRVAYGKLAAMAAGAELARRSI